MSEQIRKAVAIDFCVGHFAGKWHNKLTPPHGWRWLWVGALLALKAKRGPLDIMDHEFIYNREIKDYVRQKTEIDKHLKETKQMIEQAEVTKAIEFCIDNFKGRWGSKLTEPAGWSWEKRITGLVLTRADGFTISKDRVESAVFEKVDVAKKYCSDNFKGAWDEELIPPEGWIWKRTPREFLVTVLNLYSKRLYKLISAHEIPAQVEGSHQIEAYANLALDEGKTISTPEGVDCLEITEHMTFCIGSAVKHLWSAGSNKDKLEDLKRAKQYINREITREEKKNG